MCDKCSQLQSEIAALRKALQWYADECSMPGIADAALATPSTAANNVSAAIDHHHKHGDMDGETCLLNKCALHYPSTAGEPVWLCERGQAMGQVPTVWWAGSEWTEDANAAFRFATEADANAYIEARSPIPSRQDRWAVAVEHVFLTKTSTAGERWKAIILDLAGRVGAFEGWGIADRLPKAERKVWAELAKAADDAVAALEKGE